MSDPVLFDSQFAVSAIDPDGKKFERGEASFNKDEGSFSL